MLINTNINLLKRIFGHMTLVQKRQILRLSSLNIFLSLFDSAGVIVLGVVISRLSENGSVALSNVPLTKYIENLAFFSKMNPGEVTFAWSIICLFLFAIRGTFSPIVLRGIFRRFGEYSSDHSKLILDKILESNINFTKSRNSQQIIIATGEGSTAAFNAIPSQVVIIISEIFLVFIFCITLLIVNPLFTLLIFTYFCCVVFLLQKKLGQNQNRLSKVRNDSVIEGGIQVKESLFAFREIRMGNSKLFFVDKYYTSRSRENFCVSELQYLNLLPKFYMELSLVFGMFISIGFLLLNGFSDSIITTFGIFVGASMRLLPTFIRLQGASSGIKSCSGQAIVCLDLIEELELAISGKQTIIEIDNDVQSVNKAIIVSNLSLSYIERDKPVLSNLTFEIDPFTTFGVVGPSGAGKSSLMDVIVGAQESFSGNVTIEGLSPRGYIKRNPGAMSLVPQEVPIVNGTILENIVFGRKSNAAEIKHIKDILIRAQLLEFVENLPNGLDTLVGENGSNLSGGQRQRLGVARALFSQPRYLFLDEATSSLDANTEDLLAKSLRQLHGEMTIIIIAHRLATIRECDSIIYIENGELVCKGDFDFVRSNVPNFDHQADLLGL